MNPSGRSELTGVGVGQGIAIGEAVRMPDPLPEPGAEPLSGDPAAEKERVAKALAAVAAELGRRSEAAEGPAKEVLDAQAMMAQDPSIAEEAGSRIDAGMNGERAVFEAFGAFRELLVSMGGYMAERATDLGDVSQRVVAELRGVPAPGVPQRAEPFILIAHDLAPADTAQLELGKVLALVTRDGGPSSHTAILARDRSLPAVVGVAGADGIAEGQTLIVDAALGLVVADPSDDELAEARTAQEALASVADTSLEPGALADGTPVQILANVGKPADTARAVELGAEGVGLFRTEFLFLDAAEAPSVEEQTRTYTELLQAFPGKKVVARVLDAGADKPLAFLTDREEPNPALGLRGIRVLRAHEQILRDQLTALANAQAASEAELWVMAPMIADAEESEYFTGLCRELGIKVAGSMIEVPSAAVLCEQILASSDFVSVGTNDLTQYTLAADRLLGTVATMQDPWHPAVLRMLRLIGEAGERTGKPIGVCGEAAADPALAVVLVGLGVKSLSMTPAAFAGVRAALKEVTLDEARARAAAACDATSAAEAREAARG